MKEIKLKSDQNIFAAPIYDKDGNIYAYKRKDFPRWADAEPETIFDCHPINENGEINDSIIKRFKKKELEDKMTLLK